MTLESARGLIHGIQANVVRRRVDDRVRTWKNGYKPRKFRFIMAMASCGRGKFESKKAHLRLPDPE